MRIQRPLAAFVGSFALLMLVIQLVPYGHDHDNPPVRVEPRWDSPATRALVVDACYDCHSNQTEWPWYSNVAPVSWLVQSDVEKGRALLNFSEFDRPYEEAGEAADEVLEGEMPIWFYTWLHPHARLDAAETARLAAGLRNTLGAEDAS